MSEQAHGLRVEDVSRRPGVDQRPAPQPADHSVTEYLAQLDPAAQRSVAEVLTYQRSHNSVTHAALEATVEANDAAADRGGAT
jgi:hypothetical protein